MYHMKQNIFYFLNNVVKKVRLAQTCPTCNCLSLHVCHAIEQC